LPHVLAFIAHLEATAKAAPAKKSGARCAWYRDIRRCYAVAREAGLDVKADAKMRESFGRFLGREIESREELRAGDWYLIASEIKAHRLSW
jgi:DNA-binding Lrp family transcriptional regulator